MDGGNNLDHRMYRYVRGKTFGRERISRQNESIGQVYYFVFGSIMSSSSSPSLSSSSAPSRRQTHNIVEQVELNKSFIIGGVIGTILALVIAIATIIQIKGWRRTVQTEINNQDNSKRRRKQQQQQQQQQQQRQQRQQRQAAANSILTVTNGGSNGGVVGGCTTTATSTTAVMVELTNNTNITSRMDETIADGDESLPPIQSLPPQHLMAENHLQQSSVDCPSQTTINVNDSTNDQFYANLVSIPFRDEEDSDNAILPVQLQRLTTVDSVPLHHSDDVTSSTANQLVYSEDLQQRTGTFSHMLINDALLSSATSHENSDNDNDEKYVHGRSFVEYDDSNDHYNEEIQPDMLDGSTDELDNYKNQDLEILRTAIEQSVNDVDMLISLAVTYAYTTSTTMSTCLGWFGGEEHHSRIEASCLCDTYDWLKTKLSTMDSV